MAPYLKGIYDIIIKALLRYEYYVETTNETRQGVFLALTPVFVAVLGYFPWRVSIINKDLLKSIILSFICYVNHTKGKPQTTMKEGYLGFIGYLRTDSRKSVNLGLIYVALPL